MICSNWADGEEPFNKAAFNHLGLLSVQLFQCSQSSGYFSFQVKEAVKITIRIKIQKVKVGVYSFLCF